MKRNGPFRSIAALAGADRLGARPRMSVLAASALVHAVLVVGVIVLERAGRGREPEPDPTRIVFYEPAPPPPPVRAPVAVTEPPVVAKPPPPARTPEPAPVIAPPVAPKPVRPPDPRPVVEPSPPTPAPRAEPASEPSRPQVRTAVFDAGTEEAVSAPTAPRRQVRTTGAFAAEPADTPPTRVARAVAAGSFGSAGPASAPAAVDPPARTVVARTGFETTAAAAARAPARNPGSIRRGGFGDAEAAGQPAVARAARPTPEPTLDAPVEIVSKPRPAYTAEARERRIEGEVVLAVRFAASGRLTVPGVVTGLGYGLDEAAVAAAQEIEFKPARRDGRPVDHTATLRVVFRLA